MAIQCLIRRCLVQDATSKECGLHSGNIVTSAAEQGAEDAQKDLWPSGPVQALDHNQLEQLANGDRKNDTLVVLYAPWCQYSQVGKPLQPVTTS